MYYISSSPIEISASTCLLRQCACKGCVCVICVVALSRMGPPLCARSGIARCNYAAVNAPLRCPGFCRRPSRSTSTRASPLQPGCLTLVYFHSSRVLYFPAISFSVHSFSALFISCNYFCHFFFCPFLSLPALSFRSHTFLKNRLYFSHLAFDTLHSYYLSGLAAVDLWRVWGRDTFISMPGLLLLTNRTEDARLLLSSFHVFSPELYPHLTMFFREY